MRDEEIVELYFRRDEKAIDETDKKYGNYCQAIANNILGNKQDVDECLDDAYIKIWDSILNRLMENRKKGKNTWFRVDEIYLLFADERSASFLNRLYKRARKYGGVPTGLTQNVEDLLESDTARKMLSNCNFVMMLNQAPNDRERNNRISVTIHNQHLLV